tara:strand:+ start:3960 stop:4835 length:876 start_codon:yes stop_codon:yes gene_type:complete
MAAGGWFDWTTGDLVTESRFQDIQDSLVFIFSSESAANSALTNKVEGTIFYDTGADKIKAWNGSSWIAAEAGDIEGITTSATSGLSGGATTGTPSLSVSPNSATSGTIASGDEILFGDISDSNNLKKATAQTIADLASVTALITNVTVKVADDGSGSQNVFYMLSGSDTGSGTKTPALDVSFGMKVRFDISDSSLSGHNFKFSTTQDGNHNSGSEFTTNVTTNSSGGNTGAYVQIEITPETMGTATATGSTIETLYYYCSNHAGMGGNGKLSLYPTAASAGVTLGLVLALS